MQPEHSLSIILYGAAPAALNLRKLDALAKRHLRGAGRPARIRPRLALVEALEQFAAQKPSALDANARTPAAIHRRIASELYRRKWTRRELAKRIGRSPQTVTTLMTGSHEGATARRLLENALGLALWCSPEDFASRKVIIGVLGVDPQTLSLRKLDALAKRHLRGAGRPARIRPRLALVQALEEHARHSLSTQ